MGIKTFSPYTGAQLSEYAEEDIDTAVDRIKSVRNEQIGWRKDIDERLIYIKETLRQRLVKEEDDLARLMSSEMGKPVSQSKAEIQKCIGLLDYSLESFKKFLETDFVGTEAKKSYVRFDPLGVVLLIMPWNFPLWQVMRAAIPAMVAGNGVVLKHASIVTGTSLKIQEIFDTPLFKSVVVRGAQALSLIPHVDGVSFTGSTVAGSKIAQEAGKNIKKVVLELGGSDPFIVLPSADPSTAAKQAMLGRLQNNGQSCIASKRFIVHEKIYDEFYKNLKEEFEAVIIGDPLEENTYLGPLSSSEQSSIVTQQINDLKKIGDVESFGSFNRNIIPPTISKIDSPYSEEIFGPVAILKKFSSYKEAIELANDTPFGLGSSIWGDPNEAEKLIPEIQAGMVFVNRIVASDPRLPFGGVKKSGVGRELSRYGLLEFTNIKSVWIQ